MQHITNSARRTIQVDDANNRHHHTGEDDPGHANLKEDKMQRVLRCICVSHRFTVTRYLTTHGEDV